jgi:hypothetical protein
MAAKYPPGSSKSLLILLKTCAYTFQSYVLQQERAVLFRSLNPAPTTRSVARSSTKRTAPAPLLLFDSSRALPQLPTQAQSPGSSALDAFNPIPGSLLAKRI